jgi:GC-rich sequence DNA-binding factor
VRNGSDRDTSGSDSEKREKKQTSHAFRCLLERGVIPDANLIHLARKKRQLAREQGDFIPIEEPKPLKNASRLIRLGTALFMKSFVPPISASSCS